MRTGSALTCLKKAERVPWRNRSVRFDVDVNAYAAEEFQGCAAYNQQPQFEHLFNSMHSICDHHTIMNEKDYMSPCGAIRRAQELRASCIEDECVDGKPRHRSCLKPHVSDLWCAEGVSGMFEPCYQTRLLDQRHSDATVHSDDHLPDDLVDHTARDTTTEDATLLTFEGSEQLNYLLDSFRATEVNEVILVTYGLYAASVGTRRAAAPPDEVSIRAAIMETWIDYFVGEASAILHMVRPQEFLANIEMHFIIEFGNRIIPLPREGIPILRRTTWHEVWHDAEPVASYVSQGLSPPEVIVQCGLSEWCNVHTRTTCNLHVEKRICLPLVPVQLLPGSLVEIFIHFNAVEEEDETSLFQQSVDGNQQVPAYSEGIENIKCRTWPEPNEDFQRLLQEAEDEEPEIVAPLIGPVIFDDPDEWTRLAIAVGQNEPTPIRVVVHGLMYEEVGVRRLILTSLSARFMEEALQGLWPELDYLNKVLYQVNPQPLQGHSDEVTVILEFYDPWQARDLSIKPILLECLQPDLDVIQRRAKYCPEWVTKESFPEEPTLCPVESSSLQTQIWIREMTLKLHQASRVNAGNLVTVRYTSLGEPIEDWIQHFFPGALDYKTSTSDDTMFALISQTSWIFLEKVQPGEPSRQHTHYPPWLRYHDPYFVVQAFLEVMTQQSTGYDNYRIYAVSGLRGNQRTFVCGEPSSHHSLIQVSFSAKWDDTWIESFCYQVRQQQTTREFLRSINLEGADIVMFREGRPFQDEDIQFRNGDLIEIEFEHCSDDNGTASNEEGHGHDEISAMQQPIAAVLSGNESVLGGQTCKPNPNLGIDFDDELPYRRRTVNEEVIITRDVPPPNWADLPLYAIATSLQAVARDGAGHLYVYFRTWLLHHNRDSPVEPRDGRIRAQLMVNLHSNIRRLWREHIDPDDDIKTTVVRPNPVLDRNEGPMLLLLVECNRPIGSPTRPMLLTFQEIDVRGPEPERSWRAVLAPPTINLQYLADRCACEPQHIIAPLGTEDRRWIGQDQSRPAVSGRYIPIWFDLRRPPFGRTEPVDGTGTIVDDASSFMQKGGGRECSRSPRGAEGPTPPSTQSSSNQFMIHAYRLSREHRVIFLDRASSQSYSEQVTALWAAPAHHGINDLHLVGSPPTDLESTADATYIVEFASDRQRQADPMDRLILADIKIQEASAMVSGSHIRRVVWSRGFMSREDMLHLMSSAGICKLTTIQCEISVNHNVWPVEDSVRRQILHGDFVQLNVIGPEEVEAGHIQLAL